MDKESELVFVQNKKYRCYINKLVKEKYKLQKQLEDFTWLKSKLNVEFLGSLKDPEDIIRVLKIMGIDYWEALK